LYEQNRFQARLLPILAPRVPLRAA
jgi:hypothetical protein